jgi:phosphoribosylanthranilate isomerase
MSAVRPPLWIKVCGLRSPDAVAAAVAAGVDALGFVFHSDSPRNLSADAARGLAQDVPAGIDKVAVFLHPSQALLDEALDALQPEWVQTDAADLLALRLPAGQRVLPVLRTGEPGRDDDALPARFLLESGRSGAGERADWSQAAAWAGRGELILAGGLDPDNVAAAIGRVRPFGVDVSSGVERDRGQKDPALIRNFVNAARAAHAQFAT